MSNSSIARKLFKRNIDKMEIDDITSSVDVSMDEDDVSGVVCRSANNSPSANALRRTMLAAWSILPAELRVHIISWFDAKSLCTGAQVCHQWKYICDNEKLWEAHCRRLDKNATKPEGRTWKWLYRCKTVAFVKGVSMTHGWLEIEEPKGIYFGEWSNDVFNGMGFFEWHQHGLKYVGTYSAGFRQGQGSLVWRNGDQYTGEFEADMKHGLGTFVWSNGDVYSGNYDKDKKQGRGRITWGSHPGECYDGDWFQDKKQGYGKYIWSNGGSYEGHWFDNKRNGRGVEKWPSGSVYDGMWVENEMHGWGHKVCTRDTRPDGFYEGPFVDGRAHGRGYREYEDGSTYEGDYVADKRVGFGTYTWKDGEYFSGTWSVGRERGFYMSNNGNTFYQEWFEDKLKEDRRTGAELYQVSSSTTRFTE